MPDIKGKTIDQLPLLTPEQVTGQELIPVRIGGATKRYNLKLKPTKDDLGLGNVDNTSDEDKPVSTAMTEALDQKADRDHGHEIANVNGLQEALDEKASRDHQHTFEGVTGLPEAMTAIGEHFTQNDQAITTLDQRVDEIEQGGVTIGANEW